MSCGRKSEHVSRPAALMSSDRPRHTPWVRSSARVRVRVKVRGRGRRRGSAVRFGVALGEGSGSSRGSGEHLPMRGVARLQARLQDGDEDGQHAVGELGDELAQRARRRLLRV